MTTIQDTSQTSKSQKQAIHQQILMDWRGFVLESTDTLFIADRHRPVTEWSVFLESLFPTLLTLTLDSPELYFPKIQSITDNLKGLYDCSFMHVEWCDNDQILVWNILDLTHSLDVMQKIQQVFNEINLRKS